mmetsp:Transcript_22310/g.63684  ORF Transcript_22310/g.63684 Transcript_22310/m.63684 type:complete len:90 (+) Transcript_22310:129-398(+)
MSMVWPQILSPRPPPIPGRPSYATGVDATLRLSGSPASPPPGQPLKKETQQTHRQTHRQMDRQTGNPENPHISVCRGKDQTDREIEAEN